MSVCRPREALMWKCLLRRKGLLPCQHAVAVHTLNPLVLLLSPTCDEDQGLKTRQVMLTGVEESQDLTSLRCFITLICRDAGAFFTCTHHARFSKLDLHFLSMIHKVFIVTACVLCSYDITSLVNIHLKRRYVIFRPIFEPICSVVKL